ncbi:MULTISPECIES: O-antigen ligase family protein [Bradyrhizobium]|uniref:O-antigen ligase family protein n=1 Tax=Bradyrhizobium TaxID=374 RepID=UPI000231C70D|nr:O-antigen ligase family protein [Bradyrhizobium japonicum]AJA61322.1 ligase [Bradyrhizobium japonicum]KMJ99399.1 ligase [Bradyrhizobium japonicum]MBR0762453.1 O-antigen ligase family protein [Bradyrhizobium japonicum]MCS3533611.1 O-antigen ligase [Bradyrhizobium japonicum]MCS3990294.1 O-antigen ligase [Bradyrhizobium japonicum]
MTEVLNEQGRASWLSAIWAARYRTPARFVALVALLLPWSTTGVTFALVPWLIAFAFIDLRELPRSLLRPICLLPIALFVLALVGTLWSVAPWAERLHALGPPAKLLVIPLLIYQFERWPYGKWVFAAFLVSCALLMLYSFAVAIDPGLSLKLYLSRGPHQVESGIAVRNYIDQSQEFALCAIALVYPIVTLVQQGRVRIAALFAVLALGFLANMMFVVVSRTALVTLPVLLVVFALLHLRWRTALVAGAATALIAVALWAVSPHLRATVGKFQSDYERSLEADNNSISGMGSRLEYWRKSLGFIADAPLIGHGTGSIRGLFAGVAANPHDDPLRGEIVSNPHNQTLSNAVQWGVVGVLILYALWIAHLLMFRGEGLACWIGMLVVVQNMLSSLLNTHLFDFTSGWIYVLGVGVAGGMAFAARRASS